MQVTAEALTTLTSGAPAEACGGFPTTHWSVVLAAGSTASTEARVALEELCRVYWYPLYVFVRRQGRPHHDAQDCTQEFIARLLAAGTFGRARPDRGRFRTFLLTSLRNFLINEWRRAQTEKRGGGKGTVPLDAPADAEHAFAREIPDPATTPEQAYDRAWALQLIDHAVARLRGEYEARDEGRLFSVAAPLVLGQVAPESHATYAAQLEMSEHAFTVALQRVRNRLAERLREAVAETVAHGSDVDDELRYLVTAAAAAGHAAG
jgi:RNA polymerase sigma-70 factor (ECF subfamily)